MKPFVRTFDQAEPYAQEEPGDARFNWLLKKNELPGLCIGRVRMKGPIHKTPASHEGWDQVYVIMEGSGTVHLESESISVKARSVVTIPQFTQHSVELKSGEEIEYIYINRYLAS